MGNHDHPPPPYNNEFIKIIFFGIFNHLSSDNWWYKFTVEKGFSFKCNKVVTQ